MSHRHSCEARIAWQPGTDLERSAETARRTSLPIPEEIRDFRAYLAETCGLSESTCTSRLRYGEEFLRARFKSGKVRLGSLRPDEIMNWVASRSKRCKPGTAAVIASCLRGYLRFCHFRGMIDERLLNAVPTIAHWRLADVPKHLNVEHVQRLLSCFDGSTAAGCRDQAMALCMVEMGLRAAEVASIRLEDIDWRRSILRIHETKSGRERLLPLPRRPGCAIARYLRRSRPLTSERSLFVRHRKLPGSALTPELVRGAMRRAYARAGFPLEWCGTHILRHTAATRMLQRGATLKEIADVLGHRSINTSAIYAKVDLSALKTVALPWPESKA